MVSLSYRVIVDRSKLDRWRPSRSYTSCLCFLQILLILLASPTGFEA